MPAARRSLNEAFLPIPLWVTLATAMFRVLLTRPLAGFFPRASGMLPTSRHAAQRPWRSQEGGAPCDSWQKRWKLFQNRGNSLERGKLIDLRFVVAEQQLLI